MSNNTIINEIERLAQICRKEETNLLIGKYDLSLNQSLIHFIGNEYKLSSDSSRNSIDIKVNYLKQLFRKVPSIKITGDKSSPDCVLHLNQFVSCVCLKLIRISFKFVVGLDTIRSQLKTLECLKCFDTQVLDEEFFDLFGVWPQLTSLTLRQNNITSVKASIIPSSVKTLDLSWNRIQVFNNIANYSVNSISKLDLSYNCLKEVPKLNDFSCVSLKSLFIRGNLIEDIKGVEKLEKISELDIGLNCIVDINALISSLSRCKSLTTLWVDGNPFACDPKAYETIEKQLNSLTKLNENIIIRDNNNCDNTANGDKITTELSRASDEESEYFDASYDSMDSNHRNDGKSDGKRRKQRVVDIKEQTEVEESFQQLATKPKDINDKNDRNFSEAKELIQKRRELGDEWLVSLRASFESNSFLENIFSNSVANNDNTSSTFTASTPIPTDPSHRQTSDRKISTISSMTDDEIEVLTEEKNEWNHKDLENETNIIIVENADNNETVFIYVREDDGMIFEKDCISGKVLRTHDLKVLTNVEIINELVLKICFNSLVYTKREIKYRFDSVDSCMSFNDKFIIPWLSKKPNTAEEVYECLKCGQTKPSASQVICCAHCGSDAIMKSETLRKRRSGSDITILSQIHSQNQSELKYNPFEEINVWEELFSINSFYDSSYFTRVEHSLKLYIEVKIFPADDEEVIEGLVKCKARTNKQNRMESAFLVISNKNILILTIDETQSYDNLDLYLKLGLSKPISSLIQFKEFPHLLSDQGLWLQFSQDNNQSANKSLSKSLLNRFGSKRSQFTESLYCLIQFYDQIIGKSFINYFNTIINKLAKIPKTQCRGQALRLTENSMDITDEVIVANAVKSFNYKRNDMKSELTLTENMAVVVTEQSVILGELLCDFNVDFTLKVVYKELIINSMPQIYVNLHSKSFKLSFSDDNVETNFVINCYTNDSIKKLLVPIKSQWEKAFDVSMPLYKF